MFSKKVVVSSLLAALVGISTFAYANVKFVTTTDNSEIKFPKEAFEGTDAEKEFLATGKNIYVGDAEAIKMGKNVTTYGHVHSVTAQQLK